MKCTNCGKNNASYHYRYELNGEVTEAHLCHECAAKLQPEREFAAKSRELLGSAFDDGFFGGASGGSLFGRGFGGGLLESFFGRDPFESFFAPSPFAALGMPRIEISFPEAAAGCTEDAESRKEAKADPELSHRREINELRSQMHKAAKAEDYEKAAELRDKLRALEQEKKEDK